jgi:hypothetical protein
MLEAISEDERQTFFELWGQSIAGRDYLSMTLLPFLPTQNKMNISLGL